MKTLMLTNCACRVLIDQEDFDYLAIFNWHLSVRGYVEFSRKIGKKSVKVKLHRMVMNASDPKIKVDHINGDKLDNRKTNLRVCSQSSNSKNRKQSKVNTSGYKGVTWDKENKKWVARIMVNRKGKTLGRFVNLKDAAQAYNSAAIKYFGPFAKLNEI